LLPFHIICWIFVFKMVGMHHFLWLALDAVWWKLL